MEIPVGREATGATLRIHPPRRKVATPRCDPCWAPGRFRRPFRLGKR